MTASSSWVGFDETRSCLLNGQTVPFINPDLTAGSNTAAAIRLKENQGICFMGTTKVGSFDIDAETARKMLDAPLNPNGRPNSDVVKPWMNTLDITCRLRNMYIIDFGTDIEEAAAALYEIPFEYIKHHAKPFRAEAKSGDATGAPWWRQQRPRPEMRIALSQLERYIATPSLSKHRLFVYLSRTVIPDHQLLAFARQDHYCLGVLSSRPHDIWALEQGTQLEDRPRYTPNSTFATFPFPWPPGAEPSEAESPVVRNIADAARELVRPRDKWLNPTDAAGQPLPESDLKKRTLTNLYNERPTWLDNAHRTLDEAVFAAYRWPYPLTRDDMLGSLLALNHERAAAQSSPPGPKARKESSKPNAPPTAVARL